MKRFYLVFFIVIGLPLSAVFAAEKTSVKKPSTGIMRGNEEVEKPLPAIKLEEIQIEGNKKTAREVILFLSGLKRDQELTNPAIEEARVRILSSSLFEKVILKILPGHSQNQKIILIQVDEKISWFVVPSFSYSENALSGGLAGGDQNLFGRGKKGIFFGDWGPLVRRVALGYRDPEFFETRFILSIDGIARRDDMIEYASRQEVRRVRLLESGTTVLPGYKFGNFFTASIGTYYRRIHQTLLSQTATARPIDNLTNGNDISLMVQFNFDNTDDFQGMIRGSIVHLESQISDSRFYSDFNYFRQIVYLKEAFLYFNQNLNWINQASVQLGRTLPYYYELMLGGDNLRGYISREFRGDTKYTVQEELVFSLFNFSRFIIRGTTFWDTGVIYFKQDKFVRADWHNGIGAGLRLYLKGIAIPLIGYDFGYGIEDGAYGTYLHIGAQF